MTAWDASGKNTENFEINNPKSQITIPSAHSVQSLDNQQLQIKFLFRIRNTASYCVQHEISFGPKLDNEDDS